MYNQPPKKCPICGAKILDLIELHKQENWDKLATWIEVVDEGGGTIGYNIICHNCGKGIEKWQAE